MLQAEKSQSRILSILVGWRHCLTWQKGLKGLKWRVIWWTSKKVVEPGEGLSEPLLARATPRCCSVRGLAGSRCGMPVAAMGNVAWQGLRWCAIIFWASSKEWKEWTEVTVVHYQQNNPHSPLKVIILSLWAPVICSRHAQSNSSFSFTSAQSTAEKHKQYPK